jgi:molybdopterin molybdotransferase
VSGAADEATMASRPLIALEDAREIVLGEARPLGVEEVPLTVAHGRVLANTVIATDPVPPFDNSAMDGFAVRSADTAGASVEEPVELTLVGESRAGAPARADVSTGQAIAISTGAVLPVGADAVVPIEDARGRGGAVLEMMVEAAPGRFVRHAGDDIAAREPVLAAGTRIGPAELGVLASIGLTRAPCVSRPRIALVITGDELAGPGVPLAPGQIHDSNASTLGALIELAGADLVATEHVGDDLESIRAVLIGGPDADLILISGGVSVGEHDHVREALEELGVRQLFWGVALRPGRPTWFGTADDGALVFGLPGNPVSAMVCFTLLVRPALLAMQSADPNPRKSSAVLDSDYPKQPGRAHAVRCTLELRDDGWHARPTRPEQASHVLTSMLGAEALAMVPASSGTVAAGEPVQIELIGWPR